MSHSIKDGAGTGTLAKVSERQRLYTATVSTDEDQQATKIGNSYNVNSGVITLTDAVDTPILYVKNNETENLHITAIAVGLSPSTGGSGGIPKVTIVKNPTAGTIVSGTDVDINSNRNFGSPNTLNIDAKKGATGNTMTDGTDHLIIFQTSNGRLFATIDEILQKGDSIGIKFDPQASNTSQDVYAALICHIEDEKE